MLALTRKRGQSIVIGEGDQAVTVTVIGGRGGRVKLGFKGPREIKVLRGELVKKEAGEG